MLQDPFRMNFNVTEGARDDACLRFMKGLIEACKAYQDRTVWHPTAKNWGISSLFYWTSYNECSDNDKKKTWAEDYIHTVKLPSKTDVSIVKKILEECLLFQCDEIITLDVDDTCCLRLNCKVQSNTWIGRDLICKDCPSSLTTDIDREKWISTQISKQKSTGKKRLIFTCECYQNTSENKLDVIFTFTKPEEYVYYLTIQTLGIFLKEFMLVMCRKMEV